MLFRPYKEPFRHLLLDRVFGLAATVLPVISNRLVVIALHALDAAARPESRRLH